MADEQLPPEATPGAPAPDAGDEPATAAPDATDATGEAGAPAAGKPRHGALWLALVALCGVVGLEAAGLLLRDRLEQRLPTLAEAPAVIGEGEGEAVPAPLPGARFGPDVREVAVATADTRPAPAPEQPAVEAPAPVPAEAPAAAPVEEPAPPPEAAAPPAAPSPPVPAAAAPAPPATPAAARTHALQVGIFGSQKYRAAMERQLEEAGLPHLRRRRNKQGEGYRLALALASAGQQQKAREILDAAGVVYTVQGDSLEALFHFEAEAQRALQALSDAGLKGGYAKTTGEMPLWVVYAGPFPLEEAKRVREQLAILGLPSYLRKAP